MRLIIFLIFVFFGLRTLAESSVVIDVSLVPMGDFKAKTLEVKGFAKIINGEVSAQDVVVNIKSLKTGIELRDKHTLKYLDAEAFPEATLMLASGKDGKGTGKIKVKGIEKEVLGAYKVEKGNLVSEFKVKPSEFKITGVKYMGVGVKDEVTVHVTIPIKN